MRNEWNEKIYMRATVVTTFVNDYIIILDAQWMKWLYSKLLRVHNPEKFPDIYLQQLRYSQSWANRNGKIVTNKWFIDFFYTRPIRHHLNNMLEPNMNVALPFHTTVSETGKSMTAQPSLIAYIT